MASAQRRLAISADLTVSHGLGEMKVTGDGDHLRINLPGFALGRELARTGSGQVGASGLLSADRALKGVGLKMDVMIRNRVVGRLGSGIRPGLLDRALRTGPLQLNYSGLIRSLLTK